MNSVILYALGSVILVSLLSLVAIIPFLYKKKISSRILLLFLSLSIGALLGSVFIHFLPEAFEHAPEDNSGLSIALYILAGFLTFFILEKFVHWHHQQKCLEDPDACAHGHAYHLAPLNIIGDSIHNFLDGLVIAGSYAVSLPLGFAATTSVIFHELPQEIADYGVLLYSGWSKFKALLFNFFSASTAILGTIVGLFLSGKISQFNQLIIPFAAGNFIYIAASNLVPELHRKHKLVDTILHLTTICIGIGIMILINLLTPHNLSK